MRFLLTVPLALLLALAPASGQEKAVGKTLVVSVGGTKRLQMSTKQRIKRVVNERPEVARVAEVPGDPTTVAITGLAPGWTRVTLTGADGKVEVRELGRRRR